MNPQWRDHFPAISLPLPAEQSQAVASGNFISVLDDSGLIEASGTQAASFLHSQLTNDIEHLPDSAALWAGYCSPRGRLLATLLVWRHGESIWLETSADVQAIVQKRLSMFILRTKAKLADATPTHAVLMAGGAAAGVVLRTWFDELPHGSLDKRDSPNGMGTLILLPGPATQTRYQWILPLDKAAEVWPMLSATLTPVSAVTARWLDIQSGIPRITALTQEQFVPQMVNLELVGGVNFRKGCYPGQEVVARSQYRGTIKRRMQLAHGSAHGDMPAPGTELFEADTPEQPCGMVVNTAPAPEGGWDALVEIKLATLEQTPPPTVHAGSADGPSLRFATLPYALPDAAARSA